MKAGDIVTVAAPFDRLFPPLGRACVRWVFPGGDVWLQAEGQSAEANFDVANGPNFSVSFCTPTADVDSGVVAWAGPHEIEDNVNDIKANGSLATVTLINSTAGQNATALRAAYGVASKLEAIMIGDYLNTLTDAQLQAAFSLSAAQVTNLRNNKLIPAANTASAVRAAVGA